MAQCPNNAHCTETDSGFKYCECNTINNNNNNNNNQGSGEETEPEETNNNCTWLNTINPHKGRIIGSSPAMFYQDEDGKTWQLPTFLFNYGGTSTYYYDFYLKNKKITLPRVPELDGIKNMGVTYTRHRHMLNRVFTYENGDVFRASGKPDGTFDGLTKLKITINKNIKYFSDAEQVIETGIGTSFNPGVICAVKKDSSVSCRGQTLYVQGKEYSIVLTPEYDLELTNIKKIGFFPNQQDISAEFSKNKVVIDDNTYQTFGIKTLLALDEEGNLLKVTLNFTYTYNKPEGETYGRIILDDIPVKVEKTEVIETGIRDVSLVWGWIPQILFDDNKVKLKYENKETPQQISFLKSNSFVKGYDDIAVINNRFTPVITCDGKLKYAGSFKQYVLARPWIESYNTISERAEYVLKDKEPLQNIVSIKGEGSPYALTEDGKIYFWGAIKDSGGFGRVATPLEIYYKLEGEEE